MVSGEKVIDNGVDVGIGDNITNDFDEDGCIALNAAIDNVGVECAGKSNDGTFIMFLICMWVSACL